MSKQQPWKRLSLVEVIALCVLVCLGTVVGAFATLPEMEAENVAALRTQFGPTKFSENDEEWIIRDFFQDRRDGVFLDVGANHHEKNSNTFYLEKNLGWSGIAVDALEEFAAGYTEHRPRTRYVAMFASDVADSSVQFFVSKHHLVSSSDPEFTKRYGEAGTVRQVPTTTLNAVLEEAGIQKIDLLNMDIELAEPKALAGFALQRFRPKLVCIEAHPEVRQQILDYFQAHDYVVVGKYLRADSHNLYFQPASTPRTTAFH